MRAGSSPVTRTISRVHNERDEHSIFFCLYLIVWSKISALFLLCRGGYIVYRYALSALKSYLALSVPFGDLQTAYKAIMDNHSLSTIFSRSLNLMNFNFLYQFMKDHGVQRFHLHKAPYRHYAPPL